VRIERPPDTLHGKLGPLGALRWPGCVVGAAEVEGLGPVEFFSTRGAGGMLLVISPTRILAISPPDPDAFQRAFVAAAREGTLDPIQAHSSRPDLFPARLWADPIARPMLLAGIALPLVLLGFLGVRAASLPASVPFGFDSLGTPEAFVPRAIALTAAHRGTVLDYRLRPGLGFLPTGLRPAIGLCHLGGSCDRGPATVGRNPELAGGSLSLWPSPRLPMAVPPSVRADTCAERSAGQVSEGLSRAG
jgi:hypothetical protein